MTRVRLLVALMLSSSCGLLIDGAYLLGGNTYATEDKQTKRTESTQAGVETTVRAEQGQVWLACEEMERGIDRVWTVKKTYEYQGGIYQAHWLPILLEGLIATGVTIGVGIRCNEPGSGISCTPLWATVPLWADVAYSAVRLLTIDPPVLVNKERRNSGSEPSAVPNWRRTIACDVDAKLIVARSPEDPTAAWFRVDAWGRLDPADAERLRVALQQPNARLFTVGGGRPATPAALTRCQVLATLGRPCPAQQ
ncbi:MAG: hypothetical protein Q8S33_01485 [Myxococcales bacterium]|nr:hypothetical protein [Myxococcales bacterium]MDP3498966.1 hypothetical protein [Myxococcales bacterium]